MTTPTIKDLHKQVWLVKDTARMNNWEKRIELMALDLLFRSGYYKDVDKSSKRKIWNQQQV